MSKLLSLFAFGLFLHAMSGASQKSMVIRTISGSVFSNIRRLPLSGVTVSLKGANNSPVILTDSLGYYEITVTTNTAVLSFSLPGYITQEISLGNLRTLDVWLNLYDGTKDIEVRNGLTELMRTAKPNARIGSSNNSSQPSKMHYHALSVPPPPVYGYSRITPSTKFLPPKVTSEEEVGEGEPSYSYAMPQDYTPTVHNTGEYDAVRENGFVSPTRTPLSTFSIDVDAALYSNLRRFLNNGQTSPKDAIRIEEMVNYFSYDYPQPKGEAPFSVNTELSECPWQPGHKLLHIGLQGKIIPTESLPPANLVFLIDVSGSMEEPEKLPLLQSSFRLLTGQLRDQDRVAIVVYAGAAGLVLPSTPGSRKQEILAAIDRLQAGGSTAGGEGIQLAYKVAQENFRKEGNNRVILATDGDFNVGASSNGEMERLIEEKRESNIFLTVLGFGLGNYKDSKMETLADKGNGNYAYINNILEAKKVLVNEFGGTLFTIAKDVKLQLEFNPAQVKAYRLIGYKNRALKSEDFNNDKKDAGELGSGHTVTALYEIIPADQTGEYKLLGSVDDLKYQKNEVKPNSYQLNEWLTLKLRYK